MLYSSGEQVASRPSCPKSIPSFQHDMINQTHPTSLKLSGNDGVTRAILEQRRWDMNRPLGSTTIHSLSISRPRLPSFASWTS